MAAVISLGLHTPSALPYLIAESLLPKDPSPELYTWNTYRDGGIEEEILFTAKCVVWSQGRTIKKAFSFEIEEEDVQHAVLAWFPSHEDPELLQSRSDVPFGQDGPGPKRARAAVKRHGDRTESCRALAVFLQYQAHVFFLSGASHIVKLPFEVDKVFPAARGIVLQRKVSGEASHRPETKKDLVVPQNSFQFSASQRSFDNRFNSSSQDLCSGLDFDLLQTQNAPRDDTMPRHYSFTSPLSELSLVVRIPQANFDFRSSFSKSLASLETLDTAEEILYVSPRDELPASEPNTAPLLLVVTANYEKGSYSVWQASYMESNPLAKAMAGQSTPTAASKLRRRSSFPTTGTATPIARGNRDSLGLARIRAAGETKKPPKSRRKGSKSTKEAEDALASQVDPEFEPRHTARESRRMSSMLSRADLNPSFDRSAFQDLASHHTAGNSFASHGRRGQSLGAGSERLSFGGSQRRLRASTPGTFSRLSIEDISDLAAARHLSGSQVSMTEEIDSFADLVGGQENPDDFDLHYPLGGLKKELLLRKFAEIPIDARTDHLRPSSRDNMNTDSNSARGARVFTIASPCTIEETNAHGRRFYLYIHNPLKRDCIHIEYSVGIRKVTTDDGSQGNDKPRTVPNPSFRSSIRLPEVIDVLQLIDGEQSKMALLKNSRSGQTALQLFSPWCAEGSIKVPLPRLRMFNPFDVDTAPKTRSVGKGTMPVPKTLNRLCHGGPGGLFDVVSDDQHHQIQLLLSPRSNWVSNIMEACLFVLPLSLGEKLFMIWWNRNQTYHSILQSEWHALAVTLLSFALACEGEKLNRRTVRRPLDTQSNLLTDREKQMLKIETSWNGSSNVGPAWSWAFDPSIPRLDDATDERIDQSKGKDPSSPSKSKDPFARGHVSAAREYLKYDGHDMYELLRSQRKAAAQFIPRIVLVLHLVREEMKLSCNSSASAGDTILAPVIAQLGRWLDWPDWDWKDGRYYNLELAGVPYDFEDGM
jgi:anaphase-promoting complex subunit 1